MKKLLAIILIVASPLTFAAGGHNENLDSVYIDMGDQASLQNGAKLFVNYCLSCHSAAYMRYERVATDLDIPLQRLKDNLMFTTEKPGDLMQTSMSSKDAKKWFGVTPPDLTLVARVRSPEWIYTYLRSFYLDEKSPSGWNNSLFENVAMPHVMYELQGAPKLMSLPGEGDHDDSSEKHGDAHAAETVDESTYSAGGAVFDMSKRGKLSNAEFDSSMRDLTNFLVYMGEPAQMSRKKIGVYTLIFLLIFLLLAMVLKKEYWRDVH
ncbi:MAG: cytochrome c1 [Arenicella sp.]